MADLPWPDVEECYGYSPRVHPTPTCPQCDGSHVHRWASAVMSGGIATRCVVCGARRCGGMDPDDCNSRRHHEDPHTDGTPVGGRWLRVDPS